MFAGKSSGVHIRVIEAIIPSSISVIFVFMIPSILWFIVWADCLLSVHLWPLETLCLYISSSSLIHPVLAKIPLGLFLARLQSRTFNFQLQSFFALVAIRSFGRLACSIRIRLLFSASLYFVPCANCIRTDIGFQLAVICRWNRFSLSLCPSVVSNSRKSFTMCSRITSRFWLEMFLVDFLLSNISTVWIQWLHQRVPFTKAGKVGPLCSFHSFLGVQIPDSVLLYGCQKRKCSPFISTLSTTLWY